MGGINGGAVMVRILADTSGEFLTELSRATPVSAL